MVISLLGVPASSQAVWPGGVVAADHRLASEAGLEMLEQGGNAVDAAVAASFALSVVRPYSCGIGGGGFMLLHLVETDDRGPFSVALDYRERAPGAITPDHFEKLDDPLASRYGGHAVAVPGTVAGLLLALENWGTLDRATVLAPAIRLAERGHPADRHTGEVVVELTKWFEEKPQRKERFRFLWERLLREGTLKKGDAILNPEQGRALRMIAEGGRKAFYDGPIGEAIVKAVQADGGILTRDDLRTFSPVLHRPLIGTFHERMLMTMPPPSNGGVATIQVLGILERYEKLHGMRLADMKSPARFDYIHLVVEAMKHAFADRAEWFGDPEFVEVPVRRLIADDYLNELAAKIDPDRTFPPEYYGSRAPAPDDGGTSHLSVIDAKGNAVSCTETLNLNYGSCVGVEEFGFCLNDEMDDFTTVRGKANYYNLLQSDRNLPQPGKRPLSSMTPTLVFDGSGNVELAVGGSGGPRIITAVLETILNSVVFDMDPRQAIGHPRFHHQWMPNEVAMERPQTARQRERSDKFWDPQTGHRRGKAPNFAAVQLVQRVKGGYDAASDPRKGGVPAGR